jgi:4-hydroxybenzoate polyprenyltransferase
MSGWSPPTVPRQWLVLGIVAYLAVLAYAVLIAGQLLLGLLPGLLLAGLYFAWRFLLAFEAIADAQQRLADRHVDESADDGASDDRSER